MCEVTVEILDMISILAVIAFAASIILFFGVSLIESAIKK